ncbi:unnamed protein product [Didymodactylos carnosus]|uniref:Uncharacterized protein n=1 Tax=Didymodactylos carnosus TaxID=1234261 RepID=A0A815VGZ8_9BILA|nr:unnamed protein product [Didymodactylos carnosus]CAF4389283.1 unnamed protein product [Didymodactylos carnosus]
MFVPTVERGNDKAEKTRDDVQIYYISQKYIQMEEKFPDEIFIEFFHCIPIVDLYRAFYGLNYRLNCILMDRRSTNLSLNLFKMSLNDQTYLQENIFQNLPSIRNKITYMKSDYYVGGAVISYNLPRFLSDINNYKNLHSITLTLFNGDHLKQILNLSFESREKLTCLKLQ